MRSERSSGGRLRTADAVKFKEAFEKAQQENKTITQGGAPAADAPAADTAPAPAAAAAAAATETPAAAAV